MLQNRSVQYDYPTLYQAIEKELSDDGSPKSERFLNLYAKVMRDEIPFYSSIIKKDGIRPYSKFIPDTSKEFKYELAQKFKAGKSPLLYVYPENDKFILSYDYRLYYEYLSLGMDKLPCYVLGEPSGSYVTNKEKLKNPWNDTDNTESIKQDDSLKVVYIACEECDFTVLFTHNNKTFFFCKRHKIGENTGDTESVDAPFCAACDFPMQKYDLAEEDNVCPICNSLMSVMYSQKQLTEEEKEAIYRKAQAHRSRDDAKEKEANTEKSSETYVGIKPDDIGFLIKTALSKSSTPKQKELANNLLAMMKEEELKELAKARKQSRQSEHLKVPAFIAKIPNFLRWIIFIPCAFLAMILISGLNKFFTSAYLGIDPESFILNIYVSFIGAMVFVYVGAAIAPKKQFLISIFLSILLAALAGISLVLNVATQTYPQMAQFIYSGFTLAGVSASVYAIHEDMRKEKVSYA